MFTPSKPPRCDRRAHRSRTLRRSRFSHVLKHLPQAAPRYAVIALPSCSRRVTFAATRQTCEKVTFDGLTWFRRHQRRLARGVLGLFCLTWLQVAAIPCVMAGASATGLSSAAATSSTAVIASHATTMMATASVDHCPYCPPAHDGARSETGPAACSYPHDQQVDSRASPALGIALPAALPALLFSAGVHLDEVLVPGAQPAAAPQTSLAVSYCRFLK